MKTKYKGKQYTVSGIEHTSPEIYIQREDHHLLDKRSFKNSKADEISTELYLPYYSGWSISFLTPMYSRNRTIFPCIFHITVPWNCTIFPQSDEIYKLNLWMTILSRRNLCPAIHHCPQSSCHIVGLVIQFHSVLKMDGSVVIVGMISAYRNQHRFGLLESLGSTL